MSTIKRKTKETSIVATVRSGEEVEVETGDPFLNHMVETWARYTGLAVTLSATGDLRHHLVEDVAITLGLALADEVPDSIVRYGSALVPMDEALASVALDLGGRFHLTFDGMIPSDKVGSFDTELVEDFFQAFAANALLNLHVEIRRGRNSHHVAEALFKGVARSFFHFFRSAT